MMVKANEGHPRLKKHLPFPPEEERANVFSIGKDEIGLLDIVILDAIAKNEACNQ